MGHKPVPFPSYIQRTNIQRACIDVGNWMKTGCPSICYYGDQHYYYYYYYYYYY